MTEKRPQIVFVVGDGLVTHLLLQNILPEMIKAGLQPILFMTPGSSKIDNIPSLQHYSFYQGALLSDVIYPTLDEAKVKGAYQSVDCFLGSIGCEILSISSFDDPKFLRAVSSPDFLGVVSMRNYMIFSPSTIKTIKKKGFLWNVHTGSLPSYRGVFIPFWSMLNGEDRYGWALHDVDVGIDTGALIDSCDVPLNRTSVLHSYVDMVEDGAQMVVNALSRQLKGETTFSAQPMPAAYYTFPQEAQIQEARENGIKLWASPVTMLRLYQSLFGDSDALAEKLMSALMRHEGAARETFKLPQAA